MLLKDVDNSKRLQNLDEALDALSNIAMDIDKSGWEAEDYAQFIPLSEQLKSLVSPEAKDRAKAAEKLNILMGEWSRLNLIFREDTQLWDLVAQALEDEALTETLKFIYFEHMVHAEDIGAELNAKHIEYADASEAAERASKKAAAQAETAKNAVAGAETEANKEGLTDTAKKAAEKALAEAKVEATKAEANASEKAATFTEAKAQLDAFVGRLNTFYLKNADNIAKILDKKLQFKDFKDQDEATRFATYVKDHNIDNIYYDKDAREAYVKTIAEGVKAKPEYTPEPHDDLVTEFMKDTASVWNFLSESVAPMSQDSTQFPGELERSYEISVHSLKEGTVKEVKEIFGGGKQTIVEASKAVYEAGKAVSLTVPAVALSGYALFLRTLPHMVGRFALMQAATLAWCTAAAAKGIVVDPFALLYKAYLKLRGKDLHTELKGSFLNRANPLANYIFARDEDGKLVIENGQKKLNALGRALSSILKPNEIGHSLHMRVNGQYEGKNASWYRHFSIVSAVADLCLYEFHAIANTAALAARGVKQAADPFVLPINAAAESVYHAKQAAKGAVNATGMGTAARLGQSLTRALATEAQLAANKHRPTPTEGKGFESTTHDQIKGSVEWLAGKCGVDLGEEEVATPTAAPSA